jgi:M6 family metalloprotease-like protein
MLRIICYHILNRYTIFKEKIMKKIKNLVFGILLALFFVSCNETGSSDIVAEDSPAIESAELSSLSNSMKIEKFSLQKEKKEVPILVIIMNWNDYSENDTQLWYDKIFNKETNSLNQWYSEFSKIDKTDGESYLDLVPATETYGTRNDGIIVVEMNKNHPGDSEEKFRDIEITNAITSSVVDDNINFASFDKDGNGVINIFELQILLVVAGGEVSYGDSPSNSIWAHTWNYEGKTPPVVDGVTLMKASSSLDELGYYLRFGATHELDGPSPHKATIGIIAHEMGHSLLGQWDLYDLSYRGSGLGFYDIMSGGAWAKKPADTYDGATPTQFSAYSVMDSYYSKDIVDVSNTDSTILKCSSGEFLKLVTSKENEFFFLECRDTARETSDISFVSADRAFTDNRLFAVLYHVDTDKVTNDESGLQTQTNHYMVSVVENNPYDAMTSRPRIDANFDDTYIDGDTIEESKIVLYDGEETGYKISVLGSDYTNRTMTFSITK